MFNVGTSSVSCGLHQIYGLLLEPGHRDYKPHLQRFLDTRAASAIYLFSDADQYKHGIQFAEEITKFQLGELREIGPVRNPNSSRQIRAWLWIPDEPVIRKYLAGEDTSRPAAPVLQEVTAPVQPKRVVKRRAIASDGSYTLATRRLRRKLAE